MTLLNQNFLFSFSLVALLTVLVASRTVNSISLSRHDKHLRATNPLNSIAIFENNWNNLDLMSNEALDKQKNASSEDKEQEDEPELQVRSQRSMLNDFKKRWSLTSLQAQQLVRGFKKHHRSLGKHSTKGFGKAEAKRALINDF